MIKEFIKYLRNDILNSYSRYDYVSYLLRNIPGEVGVFLRQKWYMKRFRKAGKNLRILPGTVILNPQNITCSDNVSIGVFNYIQAGGGLKIESDVLLGPYVKIWTQNHRYDDYGTPVRKQGYIFNPVEIGQDTWIGANSFILPGTKIGNKCIISAGSVVGAKHYPEGIILAGYPARKIGTRYSK